MLTIRNRVLLPGVSVPDEVDGDVFPVVIMTVIHTKWITSSLESVPEMPGQLQEVPTADDLVVDGSIRIELLANSIVVVGSFVRETISCRISIKSYQRSEKKKLINK